MEKETENKINSRMLKTTLSRAFFSLSALVLILYTGLSTLYAINVHESTVISQQKLIAQNAADAVNGFIEKSFDRLETAVWLNDFNRVSEREIKETLRALLGLHAAFRRLVLFNDRNHVLGQSARLSMKASKPFMDWLNSIMPWRYAIKTRSISNVYIDPVTFEPMVAMAVPVLDVFGDWKGTLIAELNLKFMWDLVDRLRVGETGHAYVVDKKGKLIAFQDTGRVLRGEDVSKIDVVFHFLQNYRLKTAGSIGRFRGITGGIVVGAYLPLKGQDWAVITELPWREAYQEILNKVFMDLGLTLAIAILAGIFGMFMAKRLANPVMNLTDTASRIAAGERELQARVEGPREIAKLAVAFNSMTAQLRKSLTDLEQRILDLNQAKEEVRLNEERLRLALEGTSDGIWDWWDLETGQVYFSPDYYTMVGYEPDEFPASYESWRRLVHPEDIEAAEKAVKQTIEKDLPYAVEFRFKTKKGDWRWILGRGKVVEKDENGRAVRIAGSHTDITERKKAELALMESEQKFRAVVENSDPIIFILDKNGIFQLSEGKRLARLGLKPGQVVGQSVFELYKNLPSVVEGVEKALAGENDRSISHIGDLIFDTVFSPYYTGDGRKNGMIGISLDITERARAEEKAKEHEQRLALALQGADLGSWDWNYGTGEISCNKRWANMLGYDPEDLDPYLETWESLIHPEDLPHVRLALREHFNGKSEFYETEMRWRHKSGRWVWVYSKGKILERDFQGNPLRLAGTHLDISERKQTEEALEKRLVALTRPMDATEGLEFEDLYNLSEIQNLQDIFAKAFGVGALITRPDGARITRPSNFADLCGDIVEKTEEGVRRCADSDALIGKYNPSGPNIHPCLTAGFYNAGASISVGGLHVANWLIGPVRRQEQTEEEILEYAREIGVDGTDLLGVYHKVPVMSAEQFEDAAQVIFTVANQISKTAYQNIQQARFISERKRAEEALSKYEQIVSASPDLMALINKEFIFEAVNDTCLEFYNRPRENVLGKSVREIMGEADFNEQILPRMEKVLNGETVHFQCHFHYIRKGKRFMDITYFPFLDDKGNIRGIVANSRDITETRQMQERLAQSQKIESLGTLAGGVAHEINNPINGIMNYAQLIMDQEENNGQVNEFAGEIIRETKRVSTIVRNLLTFARHEKQTHSPALMSDIIASVLSLIRTIMRHDQIDLEIEVEEGLPQLKCRSQQIQQVIMNLMTNARDALNEKYPGYDPGKSLHVHAGLLSKNEKQYIRTTVEDSGNGISPEVRKRIFDPFFTTKEKDIGTGLGLSISYGIVKDHGGELVVESEPGRFTRFHMDLPVDNGWSLH